MSAGRAGGARGRSSRAATLAVALAAGVVVAPAAAEAQASRRGNIGLGLVLGQPTGVSVEFPLIGRSSLAAAVGLDVLDGDGFYAHADYLVRIGDLLGGGSAGLWPYLGVGGLVSGGGPDVGVRVPFGLSLEFRRAPVQVFGEIALRVIIPDASVGLGGALGFRYWF